MHSLYFATYRLFATVSMQILQRRIFFIGRETKGALNEASTKNKQEHSQDRLWTTLSVASSAQLEEAPLKLIQ
jgi:ribose 1,5-bisphosphokinase PhnN